MTGTTAFRIAPAEGAADIDAVAGLFRAYAATLEIDLAYQGFAEELRTLPGRYAPPRGRLLLARTPDAGAVGCVALRPLDRAGCCEMKRLYVAPAGRGLGLGAALVDAVLGEAARIGYGEMWLDTLPSMTAAIALYRRAGFEPMDAYYPTPVPGTLFLRRRLG